MSLPFGGVPIGVKELDEVAGWPYTYASVPFADRVATATSTMVHRIRDLGGAVLAGQTTASEFGGMNFTRTVLHGTTCNPWQLDRTPGGSSGGTAAAVAGGVLTLGTAGDGGGSIRIPAGFCGLVGLKATFGRIPLSPNARYGNLTGVVGCLSRSVRDTARWFDVANGHDARDPLSLARVEGWEDGLGSLGDQLRGMRVAVVDDWGGATVSPAMWNVLEAAADDLIADAGLVARRRHRLRAAADGRGVVDLGDDRHRLRARRRVAGVCRRSSRPRCATASSAVPGCTRQTPGRASSGGGWR